MAKDLEPTLAEVLSAIKKISGKDALLQGVEAISIPRIPVPAQQLNLTFTGGGFPMGRMVEFFGQESCGKALPNYQGVLTPEGYKPIGEIQVGDLVASNDGKFYPVLGVYPQGKKPVYELKFTYGNKCRCSIDHIWTISRDRKKTFHNETLREILDKGIRVQDKETKDFYRYEIELPEVQPIEFEEKQLQIDPYLLGCLLGDGGIAGKELSFSTKDKFIVDKLNEILKRDWQMELRKVNSLNNSDYKIAFIGSTKNTATKFRGLPSLRKALEDLGVNTKSVNKHIPKVYLFSSVEQRTELLNGLFDTDGYIDKRGCKNFTVSSEKLAMDFKFLAESLGIVTSYKHITGVWYTVNGERHMACDAYSLDLHIQKSIGSLPRKLERHHINREGQPFRADVLKLLSADYVKDEECTCIEVAAPNHLYITENCIPTHNTTTSLIVAAGFQKGDDRPIFFVDAEGTYDPFWAAKLGVDNKRVIKWCPDASTAEEVFDKCLDVAATGEVSLLIIDSFPALVPQNVEEKDMTQLTMAGISKPLSTFSQKMVKVLLKHPNVSVIGLNQIRDNMSQYGDPMQTPGGHAWRHFCSCRLCFRSDPIDDTGAILADKSDKATGVKITSFLKKNKTGPRDWKTVSYCVSFLEGFNPKMDLVDTARMLGIVEQGGSKFTYTDRETGEVYSNVGKRKFIEQLPEWAEASMKKAVQSYTVPRD